MCVLCRDTFTRSDVLKRHFQKCSIRRGNPTGGSHLTHLHAQAKETRQATSKPAQLGHDGGIMNGMNDVTENPVNFDIAPSSISTISENDGMVPFAMIPAADQVNHE
jgi:hypothetical protein